MDHRSPTFPRPFAANSPIARREPVRCRRLHLLVEMTNIFRRLEGSRVPTRHGAAVAHPDVLRFDRVLVPFEPAPPGGFAGWSERRPMRPTAASWLERLTM